MPDPVTHLSLGYIVARHLFRKNKVFFLCATMIPDIDGLLFTGSYETGKRLFKETFERFHPSLPASLFFLPFFALLVVYIFKLINRKLVPEPTSRAYILVLTAILLHLGLDMLMTGNRPFWPLFLEAGLGIIPYSIWGVVIPMLTGLILLGIDLLLFRVRPD